VHQALADTVPVVDADSMREAVRKAFDLARPEGVVLLAPACSSFDMFLDYAARGQAFKTAVSELQAEGAEP
jgi:UDP-N-acetylmuramoylalanine--D-glutamate ligase